MKLAVIFLLMLTPCALIAGSAQDDVIAIKSAIADATDIRQTSTGYSVTTRSGTRQVYRISTGYYVEGGRGQPNLQIIKTITGYRIESSASRGAAFSNRR